MRCKGRIASMRQTTRRSRQFWIHPPAEREQTTDDLRRDCAKADCQPFARRRRTTLFHPEPPIISSNLKHGGFRTPFVRNNVPITRPRTQPARVAIERQSSAQSPLSATPRKRAEVRPYASKAWGAPRPEALAVIPIACAACGKPVAKRRRRHCEECLPKARRSRAEKAIATARNALAAQSLAGDDPRGSAEAGRKRGAANAEHHRQNREWKRENSSSDATRDRARFLREITPKLDAFSLNAIAQCVGLSLAACSRFRADSRVPHPRHWEALVALVRACETWGMS